MAAASAGAIQTGFLSESIAQPSPQLQQHHSGKQLPILIEQNKYISL